MKNPIIQLFRSVRDSLRTITGAALVIAAAVFYLGAIVNSNHSGQALDRMSLVQSALPIAMVAAAAAFVIAAMYVRLGSGHVPAAAFPSIRLGPAIACLGLLLVFSATGASAADWTQSGITDPTNGSGGNLWQSVNTVWSVIYGAMWVGAGVVVGKGWFKFKEGDHAAAMWHVGGAAGLGATPYIMNLMRGL